MKINKKQILKYVESGLLKLVDEIKEKPYIIISEADFQAQLYMTLYNNYKIFRQLFYDSDCKVKTSLLHLESRYHNNWFYDIGILDPNRFDEKLYLYQKPVMVGIELKVREYFNRNEILENMEYDSYAFKVNCIRLYAEHGFVIFLHRYSELTPSEIRKIKQSLKRIKNKRKLKKVKFYYIDINENMKDVSIVKV